MKACLTMIMELSMLYDDDGNVSYDFVTKFRIDCTIRVFRSFSIWRVHSRKPQKYRATITIFTSFYIKLKYYFSVITERDSSNAAQKCYKSSVRNHTHFTHTRPPNIKLACASVG